MRVGVNEWWRIERTQTTQCTDQDKMDIKRRDGGRQGRRVWGYANGSLVLLLRWAALAQESGERERRSSNTAETGEETLRSSATRTPGPPSCASGVQDAWPFHSQILIICSLSPSAIKRRQAATRRKVWFPFQGSQMFLPAGPNVGWWFDFCCSLNGCRCRGVEKKKKTPTYSDSFIDHGIIYSWCTSIMYKTDSS